MGTSQIWAALAAIAAIASVILAIVKEAHRFTGLPTRPTKKKNRHPGNDSRTPLIILPFQDLSPNKDNLWFADALPGELIDALSHIKSLQVLDRTTSKNLRDTKQTTKEIAELFDTRYVVEGAVTKFNEKIKISASLLDTAKGMHLWQFSFNGVMDDIFALLEAVAGKIVEGLKIHLTSEEKTLMQMRGTENSEAYELFLKAREYFERQTKEGFQLAIQLCTEATNLDPGYTQVSLSKANALALLYRSYDRKLDLLVEAESLCKEALRTTPDLIEVYYPLSQIYMLRGKLAEAEEVAMEFIRKAPDNFLSHFTLGSFYQNTDQIANAIPQFEEAVRLKPDERSFLFDLTIACNNAKETEKCVKWANIALPIFERHVKLHPDEEGQRVSYALLLFYSGRIEEARREANLLKNAKDGNTLYNTAWLFAYLGDKRGALETFRKAIEAGLKDIRGLKEFLTEEEEEGSLVPLADMPHYQEVKRMVEQIEIEQQLEGGMTEIAFAIP